MAKKIKRRGLTLREKKQKVREVSLSMKDNLEIYKRLASNLTKKKYKDAYEDAHDLIRLDYNMINSLADIVVKVHNE